MKLLQKILVVFLLISTPFLVGVEDNDECLETVVAQEIQYPEKNMVIIIPSYNNCKWYERNLQSALSQNYTNFRVIYTDDCSTDGTGGLVEQYLLENDVDKKVHF